MATTQNQPLPPPVLLNQMITSTWIAQSVYVAAELGIADRVKVGPRTVSHLAEATGVRAEALHRVLRALASVGVFRETESGFEQTPLSACLVDAPGSLRAWARMGGVPWRWEMLGDLLNVVRTGQDHMHRKQAKNPFDYLASVPGAMPLFNEAMTSFSAAEIGALLEAYDFSAIPKLVDVGGGHGSLLAAVLKRYPSMRGVLYDVPAVVEGARELLKREGVADRCEVAGGDFFSSAPAGAAAYMMKHIIHDWDDEKSSTILRNVHRASAPGTKLLVLDAAIAAGNDPDPAKLLDIEMLLVGGRERSEEQFRALFGAAGFELTRIVRTAAPICVVEGMRK